MRYKGKKRKTWKKCCLSWVAIAVYDHLSSHMSFCWFSLCWLGRRVSYLHSVLWLLIPPLRRTEGGFLNIMRVGGLSWGSRYEEGIMRDLRVNNFIYSNFMDTLCTWVLISKENKQTNKKSSGFGELHESPKGYSTLLGAIILPLKGFSENSKIWYLKYQQHPTCRPSLSHILWFYVHMRH